MKEQYIIGNAKLKLRRVQMYVNTGNAMEDPAEMYGCLGKAYSILHDLETSGGRHLVGEEGVGELKKEMGTLVEKIHSTEEALK